MGDAGNVIGRVALGVVTGGGSEIARATGKAAGIDPRILNPVAGAFDMAGQKAGLPSAFASRKSSSTPAAQAGPDLPAGNDAAVENEAQKAAERRRRLFAGMGRSSTILTRPGSLGTLGDGYSTPKQLLGL